LRALPARVKLSLFGLHPIQNVAAFVQVSLGQLVCKFGLRGIKPDGPSQIDHLIYRFQPGLQRRLQ